MITIWKFPIPYMDEFSLMLPRGAEVLHVGPQRNQGHMWVRVDDLAPQETRQFSQRGTGHPTPADAVHLGTYMVNNDSLVFHVFEPKKS